MASSNGRSGGIGFLGLLAIVFITLKLCDVIDWSWWWVTAPLWGPLALGAALMLLAGLVFVVGTLVAMALALAAHALAMLENNKR